jgi:hypothetical protein
MTKGVWSGVVETASTRELTILFEVLPVSLMVWLMV